MQCRLGFELESVFISNDVNHHSTKVSLSLYIYIYNQADIRSELHPDEKQRRLH